MRGATNEVATSTYGYDALGRLNSLDHKKGVTLISGYDWTHDALHRVTSMDFTNSAYDAEDVADYGYDTNDQLLDVDLTTGTDEAYTYDENGNRTMNGYVTGANNQLLEDGTYRYTYDKEGNRIEKYVDTNSNDTLDAGDTPVTLLEWDHRNRLVKYTYQVNYGTDYRILTYEYDAFDRRVNSHTISVSTGLATRSTYWVWDGQQLALQFSDGDGAGPSAPSRTYRFLYGPGIDQVFNQEGTGSTHWLLADHLGTTREVVDDSGTLVRHYVFDAYGNLQGSTAHTLIMFAGRELDAVSGLYYVRARWYDPRVGRWVSEDPIGFAGGDTNLARYVANSPVNYTDPSGLICPCGGEGGGSVLQDIVDSLGDFFDLVWGTTTSVIPGGTASGPAEGAPGVAKAWIIRTYHDRAMRIEQEFGGNSREAKEAWKDYEEAKGKLQDVAPLDGPFSKWPESGGANRPQQSAPSTDTPSRPTPPRPVPPRPAPPNAPAPAPAPGSPGGWTFPGGVPVGPGPDWAFENDERFFPPPRTP